MYTDSRYRPSVYKNQKGCKSGKRKNKDDIKDGFMNLEGRRNKMLSPTKNGKASLFSPIF